MLVECCKVLKWSKQFWESGKIQVVHCLKYISVYYTENAWKSYWNKSFGIETSFWWVYNLIDAWKRRPWLLQYVLDPYVTQEKCERVVVEWSFVLCSVPDKYITQKLCNEGMLIIPLYFLYLKITRSRVCVKVGEVDPYAMEYVLDHRKIQQMSDKDVEDQLFFLLYVSDRFVMQELVEM